MSKAKHGPVPLVLLLAPLCGMACTQLPQTRPDDQYYVPPDKENAEWCERSAEPGYADPGALARDYVERDSRGEFGSSRTLKWLVDVHYCPVGLPGWDVVTVVKEARVDSVVVSGPRATAHVTYRQLGRTSGSPWFTEAVGDVQASLPLVRLQDGWRINVSQEPHFFVATLLAWPTFNPPDSVRARIERLAGG